MKTLTGCAMLALIFSAAVSAGGADVMVSGDPETVIIAVAGVTGDDARDMAVEAAREAIEACRGQAKGLIVYEDTDDVVGVVSGVRSVAGGLPMIGCHAVPLINNHTIKGGVGVMAIGGRHVEVDAGMTPLQDDRRQTAHNLADELTGVSDPQLVFALSEPTLSFEPDPEVTVEGFLVGMQDRFGDTPIFGGNCKPFRDMVGWQFANGQIYTGSVVGMAVSGPFHTVADHNTEFQPVGEPVTVTAGETSEDGKWWIIELDGRPATDVYRELRGMESDDEFTFDQEHPIGVIVGEGIDRRYLRMVLELREDGAFKVITEVPVGTEIEILGFPARAEAIYASARVGVNDMLGRADAAPIAVLASDCCARGFRLDGFTENRGCEVTHAIRPALAEAGVQAPLFGFYAYGEIGPIRGPFKGLNYMYQQHTFVSMMIVPDVVEE